VKPATRTRTPQYQEIHSQKFLHLADSPELTKEQLGKTPQFKTDAWPDDDDATHTEALRSYRDSIGGDVTAADNSAQNEKPGNKEVMIPTDQGNSEKDVQITQDIRSAVVGADLSFNARNIKIITKDEHVTPMGEVAATSR
jgi:osmotically-inducible protein OsmY